MPTITKQFDTLSEAEEHQNWLYGQFDEVKLVRSPRFTQDGTYTWEAKGEKDTTVSTFLTGTLRRHGKTVYFASCIVKGQTMRQEGDTLQEALVKLEEAVNEVSDHPVYIANNF